MDTYRKTYLAWWNAKKRCTNPTNPHDVRNYGERGITMCAAWTASCEQFIKDVGLSPENLVLDRINNDGNYEPGNCRWVTRSVSLTNRRRWAKPRVRRPRERKPLVATLTEVLIVAWECSRCGRVCRSKKRPIRCTNPLCSKAAVVMKAPQEQLAMTG